MRCPNCDVEMVFQEPEPADGIYGGWYCTRCDYAVVYEDIDDDLEYD